MSEINNQFAKQRTEDVPEYRSVSLQPSAAPAMRRLYRPLEKVNKPFTVVDRSCSNSEDECTSSSSSSSSFRWEINELPDLPTEYALVRTNVYVKDSSAQVVADRICNVLKTQSIAVDTKGFEEENSLLVETKDCTKLAISLFGHNDMVVVEVRRQGGCSIHFRDTAKAILRSSKGLGKQQPSLSTRKFPMPATLPMPAMLPRRSREAQHESIRDDFQIAYSMLRSKKTDAHLLALESIGKMTSFSEANVAAKLVLSNFDCLKQLLFLLDLYTEDRPSSGMGSRCHRKILEVLANSCEAISASDLAGILSTNEHDLKTRSFLSFLLSSLREASIRPHDAFQAARCMRCLLISKEVESSLVEMSAIDAISSARNVGLNSHQALEQESYKLMGQLQNVC